MFQVTDHHGFTALFLAPDHVSAQEQCITKYGQRTWHVYQIMNGAQVSNGVDELDFHGTYFGEDDGSSDED